MQEDSTVTRGRSFLVTDADGRLSRRHDGFYHRDTRHLDTYDLDLAGADVETLAVNSPRPGERVVHAATPLDRGGRALRVARRQVVSGGLFERVEVENLSESRVEDAVAVAVGTRFRDVFEVRSHRPAVDRDVGVETTGDALAFAYEAPDVDFARRTTVATDADARFTAADREDGARGAVSVDLSLAPGESLVFHLAASPGSLSRPVAEGFDAAREAVVEREADWRASTAVPAVSPGRRPVVERAVEDLLTLRLDTDRGPLYAAGTPWFATAFGRDSLVAALQTLDLTVEPARGTLRYLAAHQATDEDAFRDAAPGKIMHEIREGETTARGDSPHSPYYGTVDATPLFVVLLHEVWARTGDDALVRDLREALGAALDWMDEYGDRDGDGFLEYPTDEGGDGGLTHQAWKDSGDGIVHPDGAHPTGPLAVAEVQGYWYDAKRRAAALYRDVLGDADRADALAAGATDLKSRFDEAFWLPEEEYYAVALDGENEQVRAVTTNPGHCLWSGVVPAERAPAVRDRLLADDMFTGWGVRTLSADHDAYNPQSYHRGSVWPHDNSLIALGLANYGFRDAVEAITGGLFDAARERDADRLPELFAGYDRDSAAVPVPYGEACEPQAWAAGAPLACLRAIRALDAGGAERSVAPSVE